MASNYLILGNVLNPAGVPPVAVTGSAPTAGMVIAATNSNNAVWADVGAGTITLNGDVTGAGNANTVISITGAAGKVNVSSAGNVITWDKATTAPGLGQSTPISDVATANLTITSQAPYASAATNLIPGNINLNLPAPVSGTNRGAVAFQSGGTTFGTLQTLVGNAAYGALYLNGSAGITPSTTNYTVAHDTTDGLLNLNVSGSNGTISLLVNAVTEMSITNSSVTIKQPITFRTNVFNDATATPVTTTDGTLTTIYTDSAIPASTMYDYVVTVVGLDSTDGYGYRADFSFSYQRIASAAPTVVGASPVPLNVRASTGAVSWGGGSIALSTNSVIVQVQGIASRTIDWNCSVNRIKVA